jgi:hypothetical protein
MGNVSVHNNVVLGKINVVPGSSKIEFSIEPNSHSDGSIDTSACRIEEARNCETGSLKQPVASHTDDATRRREGMISNWQIGPAGKRQLASLAHLSQENRESGQRDNRKCNSGQDDANGLRRTRLHDPGARGGNFRSIFRQFHSATGLSGLYVCELCHSPSAGQ